MKIIEKNIYGVKIKYSKFSDSKLIRSEPIKPRINIAKKLIIFFINKKY